MNVVQSYATIKRVVRLITVIYPPPSSPHPPQRLRPCALPSLLSWCLVLVPPVVHVEVCWPTGAHKVWVVAAACVHTSDCVLAVSAWAACWLKSTTHRRVAVHTAVKPQSKTLWWPQGLRVHRTWRVWLFVLGQPHPPMCATPLEKVGLLRPALLPLCDWWLKTLQLINDGSSSIPHATCMVCCGSVQLYICSAQCVLWLRWVWAALPVLFTSARPSGYFEV